MKLNNKGFTLIEVLAIIVIITVLGAVAIPNILSALNSGKQKSYDIMIENIKTGAINLYEELYSNQLLGDTSNKIYKYENYAKTSNAITINSNEIKNITLQTLVSNGYLSGTSDNNGLTSSIKLLINPKNNEEIGCCKITIKRTSNINNYKVQYTITSENSMCYDHNGKKQVTCPTTADYTKGV